MKPTKLTVLALASLVMVVVIVAGTLRERQKSAPAAPVALQPRSSIDEEFQRLNLRQKVAKLFIFHKNTQNPQEISQFMASLEPGGLILMKDNIPSGPEALNSLTAAIRGTGIFQPLVAIDEEGATVKRLDNDILPGGIELANAPSDTVRETFRARSELLRTAGITLNFGIVADTTSDPSSFIYQRVISVTSEKASQNVAAALDGSRGLVLSTVKHFPGHGTTSANSHFGVPVINMSEVEWRQQAWPPFSAAITHGVDLIMFSHLGYSFLDTKPASLSKAWHDLLEKKLSPSYRGVTITDDMFMLSNSGDPAYADIYANAVTALLAGNTMLLYVTENTPVGSTDATSIDQGKLVDYIVRKVNEGTIPQELIDKNVRKVLDLQRKM